jgi:hypothetical protein
MGSAHRLKLGLFGANCPSGRAVTAGHRECLALPAGEWWTLSGISAFLCTRPRGSRSSGHRSAR